MARRANERKIHFQTKKQNKQFINHKAFRYLLEKREEREANICKILEKKVLYGASIETDDGGIVFSWITNDITHRAIMK